MNSKGLKITSWILQIVAAFILLQTLFFKFTGAPEPVAIFTALGAEPWGRYGSGIMELITGGMLLVPKTAALGGLLGAGIMVGAIASHLTVLGITLEGAGINDGGVLFTMAIVVLLASGTVAFLRRSELLSLIGRFR